MRLTYADAVRTSSVDEVVVELIEVRAKIQAMQEAEYLLSRQVIESMERDGSERIRTPSGVVTIPRSVTYDATILARLREITDPDDLDGIYYPEHEETRTVPERWNMAKGRKLLKYSGDHAAIIADAKIYGSPKVKIEIEKEARRDS